MVSLSAPNFSRRRRDAAPNAHALDPTALRTICSSSLGHGPQHQSSSPPYSDTREPRKLQVEEPLSSFAVLASASEFSVFLSDGLMDMNTCLATFRSFRIASDANSIMPGTPAWIQRSACERGWQDRDSIVKFVNVRAIYEKKGRQQRLKGNPQSERCSQFFRCKRKMPAPSSLNPVSWSLPSVLAMLLAPKMAAVMALCPPGETVEGVDYDNTRG